MNVADLKAIDVHGHYGDFYRNTVPVLTRSFMSATPETVAARARSAGTRLTMVSPLLALFPRGEANSVAGNEEAARVVPEVAGLRQYVVINPLQPETFDQARRMLHEPHCVGIKIHPEEHVYPIAKHGAQIFQFAAEHKSVVLTHSGEENSIPEDMVSFADDHPEVTLILAHLGCGYDNRPDHQVRAIQKSKRGNIYVDTSSAQSIMPGLIEWAVREIGHDRILFDTDTPLYHAAMQRARIDQAEISDEAKSAILVGNAERLFPDAKL